MDHAPVQKTSLAQLVNKFPAFYRIPKFPFHKRLGLAAVEYHNLVYSAATPCSLDGGY